MQISRLAKGFPENLPVEFVQAIGIEPVGGFRKLAGNLILQAQALYLVERGGNPRHLVDRHLQRRADTQQPLDRIGMLDAVGQSKYPQRVDKEPDPFRLEIEGVALLLVAPEAKTAPPAKRWGLLKGIDRHGPQEGGVPLDATQQPMP